VDAHDQEAAPLHVTFLVLCQLDRPFPWAGVSDSCHKSEFLESEFFGTGRPRLAFTRPAGLAEAVDSQQQMRALRRKRDEETIR
jgi:hypothetical protein